MLPRTYTESGGTLIHGALWNCQDLKHLHIKDLMEKSREKCHIHSINVMFIT